MSSSIEHAWWKYSSIVFLTRGLASRLGICQSKIPHTLSNEFLIFDAGSSRKLPSMATYSSKRDVHTWWTLAPTLLADGHAVKLRTSQMQSGLRTFGIGRALWARGSACSRGVAIMACACLRNSARAPACLIHPTSPLSTLGRQYVRRIADCCGLLVVSTGLR